MSKPEHITGPHPSRGNVNVASGTCWNVEQLGDVIEEHNKHNELIKLELTIDAVASYNKAHNWIIWYYNGFEERDE